MFHVKHLAFIVFFFPIISFAQISGSTQLPDKDLPVFPMNDIVVNEFNKQFPEIKLMPLVKQEWFYWTNYSRTNPRRFYDSIVSPVLRFFPSLNKSYATSLKQDLYKIQSLPMVKPGKSLEQIAQSFATEMADKNATPSHTSPSGVSFQSRMESIGIKYCAGENLSYGPSNTMLMLILLYLDEGVPGLGHRKSLLDPTFTDMGIGYADYSDRKHIVVQDFSCDQNR